MLGSEENPVDTGTIYGGVHAADAMSVQIHFTTINGGIDLHGGSGPFGGPFDVTWNTIEDSLIHGGVTISGYNGFWMGFIRNDVHGSVNLNDNVLVDDGRKRVRHEHDPRQPQLLGQLAGASDRRFGRRTERRHRPQDRSVRRPLTPTLRGGRGLTKKGPRPPPPFSVRLSSTRA